MGQLELLLLVGMYNYIITLQNSFIVLKELSFYRVTQQFHSYSFPQGKETHFSTERFEHE